MQARTWLARACAVALSALALLPAPPSSAQESPPPGLPRPYAVRQANAERGHLATVAALEALEPELDDGERDMWRDVLATELTFVHDWRTALHLDCTAYAANRPSGASDPGTDGFEPTGAVTAILEAARGRRVVMLNEEHRRSQQRAFAHQLLGALAAEGFTHLALETLTRDGDAVSELNRRGYPLESDGFYTKDPVLGDLVRRALELGLEVTGYEAELSRRPPEVAADPLAATNWREERQAANLAAILEAAPEARLIVWCGRHHLLESEPSEGGGDWTPMGGIFKRTTGVDPLTVDLMVLTEADLPEREGPAYRALVDAHAPDRPSVFRDAEGARYSTIDELDLMVLLQRTTLVDGRPAWMSMGGLRQPHAMDLDGIGQRPSPGAPLALEARVAGEADGAVPVDRVLWRDGEAPSLMLRPGLDYVLRLLAPGDEVLASERVDLTTPSAAGD
ncbi:hypothetical protein [Engelhardtia mirabilis]|uniref:Erythromycin esterase n=1 Tax=Engelhardtia mirabilis TaxID=2528011 RepID=A0A518BM02_9BACT|nr:hypothetical protein Pla133_30930 [Planctomycetes bacterium Pla133]QDV02328.1 hypothetical protein Pla86_30920 [Planctomycetes bacterium Pla86]